MRHFLQLLLLLAVSVLGACSGGDEASSPTGWVTITDPTSESTYTTSDIHSISLSGESFVSQNAEMIKGTRCNCVGLGCLLEGSYCETVSYFDTKVTVTVVNETTGDIRGLGVTTEFESTSSIWMLDIPVLLGENIIKVTAVDGIGNSADREIKIIVNDTLSPTIPGGVLAEYDPVNKFSISWVHSSDNYKVARYKIYRDDLFFKEIVLTDALLDDEYLEIHDPDATQGLLHCYHVTAHDGAGNISPSSLKTCASSSTNSNIDYQDGDYYAPPSVIALDTNGNAHITYNASCDNSPCTVGPIKYAHNVTGNWEIITLDDLSVGYPESNPNPTITIDDTGYAHIAYCKDSFYYQTNQSGIWVETNVYISCNEPDIYLDNVGNIHLVDVVGAVLDPKDLRYHPDVINMTTLSPLHIRNDLGRAAHLSKVEIDSKGYAHIAYHDSAQVSYATNKSAQWSWTQIASMSKQHAHETRSDYPYFDLAIDSLDNPHIFYIDIEDRLLKHAQLLDGQWQISEVNAVRSAGPVSLNIDEQNRFHVTVGDGNYFYYSTNVTGKWETFDVGYKREKAGNMKSRLDNYGKLHVVRAVGYATETVYKYSIYFAQ